MHRKILTELVLASLMVVPSMTSAFQYISHEGGYQVEIPDKYSLVVTKDMVTAMDSASGSHSFAAKELQKDGKTLATKDFELLLKEMGKDVKAGKDIFKEPAYAFLVQPQKIKGSKVLADSLNTGKFTYQLTKIAGVPALAYQNVAIVNYKLKLPQPLTKEEQERSKMQNPELKFSADGKEMDMKMTVVSDNYLLSKRDKFIQITNGYTQKTQILDKSREKLNEALGKEFMLAASEPFSLNSYKKATQNFVKSLKFIEPGISTEPLSIQDAVFLKNYSVPHDWCYFYTQGNNAGTRYTVFGALPLSGIEEYAQGQFLNKKNWQIDTKVDALNITSNLGQMNLQDLLKVYQEGIMSLSLKFSPREGDKFGLLLHNPALTRIMFNRFMQQDFLTASQRARMEHIFKMSNLHSKMDINPDNALFNVDGSMEMHVPQNLDILTHKDYDIFKDKALVPFQSSFEAQLYLNNRNMLNVLCYMHKEEQNTSKVLTKTMQNFNLYQQASLRNSSEKL